MQRVKVKYEPTLKIHRYIMVVHHCGKAKYHYLANRKEVRAKRKTIKQFDLIEVFAAHHDFKEAWVK